ncbi:Cell cycle checkpoint protein rad17 [Cichlidogyrus casuarinus]|uniref:Cell cycle checkpoint protein rad17 n=1 Tax=Cichlidogyrus casuarinus TaxID=1844966 RepID=A0ABD2Q743_9PLAT
METKRRRLTNFSTPDWIVPNTLLSEFSVEHSDWCEVFAPNLEEDVAVHATKKKALSKILQSCISCRNPKLILLTGPVGCGKSTLLRLMVKNLHGILVDVQDIDNEYIEQENFFSCLIHHVKYNDIADTINSKKPAFKLLLLENFPHSILANYSEFADFLTNLTTILVPNLIICVILSTFSEYYSSFESSRYLEQRLMNCLDNSGKLYAHLEFNAIASTFIQKALKRILDLLNKSYPNQKYNWKIQKAQIVDLSTSCEGDLRTAIYQMQFLLEGGQKVTQQLKDSENLSSSKIGIFHSVGKILHAKREVTFDDSLLPLHLASKQRPRLSFNLDHVLDNCGCSADSVVTWLHENYLDFVSEGLPDSLVRISDAFSECDSTLNRKLDLNWRLGLVGNEEISGQSTAGKHYYSMTVSRTILFESYCQTKSQGFKPIRFPLALHLDRYRDSLRGNAVDNSCQLADFYSRLTSVRMDLIKFKSAAGSLSQAMKNAQKKAGWSRLDLDSTDFLNSNRVVDCPSLDVEIDESWD